MVWSLVCLASGIVALACGWLVPAHMRAVDISVIKVAGERPTGKGLATVASPQSGVAEIFGLGPGPVTPTLVPRASREKVLVWLALSTIPAVQELMRTRGLTNTQLFPPSSSSSGQAFDAAVSISGLLLASDHLQSGLNEVILRDAKSANSGGDTRPIEEILMDELSLGTRLNWRQLAIFNDKISDAQSLGILADAARNAGEHWPVLFSAVEMSGQPGLVARYLSNFNDTGLRDLGTCEPFGSGAVNELLHRDQRLFSSTARQRAIDAAPLNAFVRSTANFTLRQPALALAAKWLLYLTGGFLIALSLRFMQGTRVPRQPAIVVLAREMMFASGVLLMALLLSEPFLALEGQKAAEPFRLRLPAVGGTVASQINRPNQPIMNTQNMTASLLTLLLFFILQALIYMACLARLAETLRQNVSARVKLKLLENEEHLFDAGLYLGFVGTIICLILVSLHVFQFSLMAAYSSTSFGIIFVSILKIFNVRPARRRLLFQAETESAGEESHVTTTASMLVTAP